MYDSQDVAFRIKSIAKQKGVSIMKLQEDCGLGKNAISQLANSQDGMKSKNLNSIANYLDVSVDYLLGNSNEQKELKGLSMIEKVLIKMFNSFNEDEQLEIISDIQERENKKGKK